MVHPVDSRRCAGGNLDKPVPAYRGDEPYVFVCYAHEDDGKVYPEIEWLYKQGINLWYDEGISAGRIWREEIGDAIKSASNILYYISESSVASDHCSREINFALDQHKNVLPVYLEDVALTTDLEVGLSRVQALHRDEDASYKQHLLNALGQAVEVGQPVTSRTPNFHLHPTSRPKVRSLDEPKSRKRLYYLASAIALFALASVWWARPSSENVFVLPTAELPNTTPSISIAVLPFINMTNDPEQKYFSDGITENILNELARNTLLTVRPKSSVVAVKGASTNVLNVTHLLEGSTQHFGKRVRVTVQLSEMGGNRLIWSEQYERELTDIFAIQDEITRKVIDALNAQFVIIDNPEEHCNTQIRWWRCLRGISPRVSPPESPRPSGPPALSTPQFLIFS